MYFITHKNLLTIKKYKFKRKEDEVKSLNFFLIIECLLVPYFRPFAGPFPCAGGGIFFPGPARKIMPNNVF